MVSAGRMREDDRLADGWLRAEGLCRHYRRGPQVVKALDGVDLSLQPGEFLACVGASGSGKSTLLNLLAGLDTPTSGRVLVEGRALSSYSRRELAAYRANRVGMIFQSFHLIPHCTALENVELALCFAAMPRCERRPAARSLLERLGLGDRLEHKPADLSGGEQQRVAIARALAGDPDVLLADEPTGNLDADNARRIAALLCDLNRQGRAVVMTTHNLELAAACAQRTLRLDYGRLVESGLPAEGGAP
jgi:putative ABC transport system ATP-binding protein